MPPGICLFRHVLIHHRTQAVEATTGQADLFRRDGGQITIDLARHGGGRGSNDRIGGQREQNHQKRNQQTSHNSSAEIAVVDRHPRGSGC